MSREYRGGGMMLLERPVVFENEGEQLVGMVHEPAEDGGAKPGVVMLHGFTGNRIEQHQMFVKTARKLAQAGFYVLRFDFRGSGESQGQFIRMTVSGEISDALAAIRWFKENTGVDPNQIAVLGLSMGGCVAAYTAVQSDVKALVFWSGVAKPVEVFAQDAPYEVMLNQVKQTGYLDFKGWKVGYPFVEELHSLDPLEVVREYIGPILVVHGSKDPVVPVEHGQCYYEEAGSEDKEMIIIGDADHTYNKTEWEQEVITKTTNWLLSKLQG